MTPQVQHRSICYADPSWNDHAVRHHLRVSISDTDSVMPKSKKSIKPVRSDELASASRPEGVPEPAQRAVDLEVLRPIAREAKLIDVAVVHFSGDSSKHLRGVNLDRTSMHLRFRATRTEDTDPLLLAMLEYTIDILEDDEVVANAKGQLAVVYSFESSPIGNFTADALDLFAEVNGTYNAWPYLRELITDTFGRIGLTGLFLPLWFPPSTLPPKGQFIELRTGR